MMPVNRPESVPTSPLERAVRGALIKLAVLAGLAVCAVIGLGVLALVARSGPPPGPEVTAFRAADERIVAWSGKAGFGNTPEAEALAEELSLRLQTLQKAAFTGGKDEGRRPSLSGGNFITYCQLTDEGACFLVHVPQLKNYKREVRDALIDLAWQSARSVTDGRRSGDALAVGLRGAVLYGGLAAGRADAERPATLANAAAVDTTPLHAFFAAPRGTATPAITEVHRD